MDLLKVHRPFARNSPRKIPNPNLPNPGKSRLVNSKRSRTTDFTDHADMKNYVPNISAIRVIRGHLNRQIPKEAEPRISRITRIWKNYIPNISAIRVIRGHAPL
jgi:hypothetical protein